MAKKYGPSPKYLVMMKFQEYYELREVGTMPDPNIGKQITDTSKLLQDLERLEKGPVDPASLEKFKKDYSMVAKAEVGQMKGDLQDRLNKLTQQTATQGATTTAATTAPRTL